MEIQRIEPFLQYYGRIRFRTRRIVDCIPADKIEWTNKPGKFTLGDQVRHIACIERHMYAEAARFQPSRYNGCGPELASGLEEVIQFLDRLHAETLTIFQSLSDSDLQKKTTTPAGTPITLWKWLRAMVEHEIHHRGQLYMMLGMLDVPTPPIFGLTSEEVADRSIDSQAN